MNNILAVVAHPDDLEIMAGGAMLKWKKEGMHIHVLIFTDGSWYTPDGIYMRDPTETKKDIEKIVSFMNYDSCETLDAKNTHLEYEDRYVCEVLNRIKKYNIDTIVTTWSGDINHDHEVASRIAKAASRRIPRFLEGQVNYYMNEYFVPNFYVDITEEWGKKIEAVSLYRSEWQRGGVDWGEFMDAVSHYYGKVVGVRRAEAFYSPKFLL